MLRTALLCSVLTQAAAATLAAQVPAPFPRPAQPAPARPQAPPVAPPQPAAPPAGAPAQPPAQAGEPTEATLGVPIYPSARYLESYDAGRGQRFHVFGSESDFLQIVAYYRTTLRQRGDLVFETPPVHMFELGRFREETMAFPPSVTVKDYGSGGAQGYLNPKRDGTPARFRTIIQIVPAPPPAPK